MLCCRPGKDRLPDRQRVAYVIRAAVLGQLLLDGHLEDMDGIPERAVLSRLTDPVLEQVASEISGSKSRSWRAWVRRTSRPTLDAVQEQLITAGIVRTYRKKVLGLFSRTAIVVEDQALLQRLRARLEQALSTGQEVSPQDALLVALVVEADLRWVLSRSERRAHRDRIAELVRCSAPVAPALKKVVSSTRAVRASAASSGGS